MNRPTLRLLASIAVAATCLLAAAPAAAQKVYLNPSDQTENSVSGGGNEAQYALLNANLAETILDAAGFDARVDQDFYNAPGNANSWGADIFVSIHTNAGGGHGIETLWVSSAGEVLAGHVQDGLLSTVPYPTRGLKYRDNLHVLNTTDMPACLTEALFHDCTAASGYQGHPPSESEFLRSAAGQQSIAAGIASGVCTHFGTSCGSDPVPPKGWLRGVVYQAPNLDAIIDGAAVQVLSGPSSTTGPDGAFAFELDPGSYTVTASKTGFLSGSSTRSVVAGQDVWGSIGLVLDTGVPDASVPPDAPAEPDAPAALDASPDAGDGPEDAFIDAGGGAQVATYGDPSGCACSAPMSRDSGSPWWVAVAASVAATLHRRRRLL